MGTVDAGLTHLEHFWVFSLMCIDGLWQIRDLLHLLPVSLALHVTWNSDYRTAPSSQFCLSCPKRLLHCFSICRSSCSISSIFDVITCLSIHFVERATPQSNTVLLILIRQRSQQLPFCCHFEHMKLTHAQQKSPQIILLFSRGWEVFSKSQFLRQNVRKECYLKKKSGTMVCLTCGFTLISVVRWSSSLWRT